MAMATAAADRIGRGVLALGLALAAAAPAPARAADRDDYRVDNSEWNGLSDLAALAAAAGLEVEARDTLDWSEIRDEDVLCLFYPRQALEPRHVAAYLRRGGRLLLADDFGRAAEAFAKLGMLRRPVSGGSAAHWYEENPALPIARPLDRSHPLAAGVEELITNHPAAFQVARGPDAVFGFDGGDAVVVAGALGEGRFVALADPSVLINGMLAFDGNATFAANVLRFLGPEGTGRGPGRMLVLHADFELTGEPPSTLEEAEAGGSLNEILADFAAFLDELNDWVASDHALRVLAAFLAAAVLLAAAVVTLRRVPAPDGGWTRVRAHERRDFERLVARFDRPRVAGSFAYPAAVLRQQGEARLAALAAVADLTGLGAAELAARVARAAGPRAGHAARQLVPRLRSLPTRAQAQLPWGARYVSRRELERVQDLLAELEEAVRPARTGEG